MLRDTAYLFQDRCGSYWMFSHPGLQYIEFLLVLFPVPPEVPSQLGLIFLGIAKDMDPVGTQRSCWRVQHYRKSVLLSSL